MDPDLYLIVLVLDCKEFRIFEYEGEDEDDYGAHEALYHKTAFEISSSRKL
jgi:hypothetical protein